MSTVRAKFKCDRAEKYFSGDDECVTVYFNAVIDDSPENASWSKWTPSGQLQMTISNPALLEHFVPGKEYFLDIAEAK
jgi:hypothetical protein